MIGLDTTTERDLLIMSPEARKAKIKQLKDKIKAEKKAHKDFQKIADLEAKLAEKQNHNNYQYTKAKELQAINKLLSTGEYVDTPIGFLKEQKLIVDLYKNRKNLAQQGMIQLNIDGQTINVYNEARLRDSKIAYGQLVNCNQPQNIAEKLLTENTEIPLSKAREML